MVEYIMDILASASAIALFFACVSPSAFSRPYFFTNHFDISFFFDVWVFVKARRATVCSEPDRIHLTLSRLNTSLSQYTVILAIAHLAEEAFRWIE